MKKKQKREWCTGSNIKLPSTYKHKHFRCKCGKRFAVIPFLDWSDAYYDFDRFGKRYLKIDTLWKHIKPHKTKVKYRDI